MPADDSEGDVRRRDSRRAARSGGAATVNSGDFRRINPHASISRIAIIGEAAGLT
jgi:hypothetical protein